MQIRKLLQKCLLVAIISSILGLVYEMSTIHLPGRRFIKVVMNFSGLGIAKHITEGHDVPHHLRKKIINEIYSNELNTEIEEERNSTALMLSRRTIQTLRVSSEVQEKILRLVNCTQMLTEIELPRPLFQFILEPTKKVEEMKREEKNVRWRALNMIKSTVTNRDRRDAIRETWGGVHRLRSARIDTIFIVGNATNTEQQQAVEEEFNQFGDILQIIFEENYKHISDKTLAGMQWAADILPSDWIYSSGDDDFVLHVGNFVRSFEFISNQSGNELPNNKTMENLPIVCFYYFAKDGHPIRDPKSKWYVSKELYPIKDYPPYCGGGWYSAPVAMVAKLYSASRLMPFFHLDDVWITGLMRVRVVTAHKGIDEKVIPTEGITMATLPKRNNEGRWKDLSTIFISHNWGDYGKRANIGQAMKQTWKKWEQSVFERSKTVS